MVRYVAGRALFALLALFVISLVVFVLVRFSGDPASAALGVEATPADIEIFRHEWGLDRPIAEQYAIFLWHLVRGDLGLSIRSYQPALSMVFERLGATVKLTAGALLVTLVVSVPLGILSALHRNTVVDAGAMTVALLGQSLPNFYLGIVLILLFAVNVRWFPPGGGQGLAALVLPSISLGMYTAALSSRLMRSALLEVYRQDYVRTARAKGLDPSRVVWPHALKNAILPVVTIWGVQIGHLLGGAVVTETVFSYPGVGLLLSEAIFGRDFPVIQAAVLVIALIVVSVTLATDLLYAYLDPRIRYA